MANPKNLTDWAELEKLLKEQESGKSTKIDREHDHPWIAAIGVALSELGAAMQNRSNRLAAAFFGSDSTTLFSSVAAQR